jgi:hypothetical protein
MCTFKSGYSEDERLAGLTGMAASEKLSQNGNTRTDACIAMAAKHCIM